MNRFMKKTFLLTISIVLVAGLVLSFNPPTGHADESRVSAYAETISWLEWLSPGACWVLPSSGLENLGSALDGLYGLILQKGRVLRTPLESDPSHVFNDLGLKFDGGKSTGSVAFLADAAHADEARGLATAARAKLVAAGMKPEKAVRSVIAIVLEPGSDAPGIGLKTPFRTVEEVKAYFGAEAKHIGDGGPVTTLSLWGAPSTQGPAETPAALLAQVRARMQSLGRGFSLGKDYLFGLLSASFNQQLEDLPLSGGVERESDYFSPNASVLASWFDQVFATGAHDEDRASVQFMLQAIRARENGKINGRDVRRLVAWSLAAANASSERFQGLLRDALRSEPALRRVLIEKAWAFRGDSTNRESGRVSSRFEEIHEKVIKPLICELALGG